MSSSSDSIEVLDSLQAVRRRPAMYVGPLNDPGVPNLLLQEALCCARDDARLGHCSQAVITLRRHGEATVRDFGSGLPLELHRSGRTLAEVYLTVLLACAKAKPTEVAASTCTFGLAVLNALSATLRVRIFTDGAEWSQSYDRGRAVGPLAKYGATNEHGTELSFALDSTILPAPEFALEPLVAWIRNEVAGMQVTVRDERTGAEVRVEGKIFMALERRASVRLTLDATHLRRTLARG